MNQCQAILQCVIHDDQFHVSPHTRLKNMLCVLCPVVIIQCEKMTSKDILFLQPSVIEFLVNEEIRASNIKIRFQCAYADTCMGVSSVR
jgi:hypothetical protein